MNLVILIAIHLTMVSDPNQPSAREGFSAIPIYWNKNFSDTTPYDYDKSLTITLKEFEKKIDECIILLKAKPLRDLTDSQHRQIILCHNTRIKEYFVENFEEFGRLLSDTHYVEEIKNIYPDWLPSRGLGYYFPKLQVQFMGASNPKYRYEVIK